MEYYFAPFGCIGVFGCSSSGKSTLVQKMLRYADKIFAPPLFKEIYYFSGSKYRPSFEGVKQKVHYVRGIPSLEVLEDINNSAIVLDDSLESLLCNANSASFISTRLAHHNNNLIIILLQELFIPKLRIMLNNLNAYIFLKNDRWTSKFQCFARQCAGSQASELIAFIRDCHKVNWGYVVIDFSPQLPSKYRYRSTLFPFLEDLELLIL